MCDNVLIMLLCPLGTKFTKHNMHVNCSFVRSTSQYHTHAHTSTHTYMYIVHTHTHTNTQATETRQRAFEAAEAASEVCERIETNRTQKSINTEITKLKRRITQEEPRYVVVTDTQTL